MLRCYTLAPTLEGFLVHGNLCLAMVGNSCVDVKALEEVAGRALTDDTPAHVNCNRANRPQKMLSIEIELGVLVQYILDPSGQPSAGGRERQVHREVKYVTVRVA